MRPHRLVLLAVLATALTACQTVTPEERRAADERTCAGYGFKAGTDGMARCLLDLELDRRADQRQWQAQISSNRPYFLSPVIVEQPVIVRRR